MAPSPVKEFDRVIIAFALPVILLAFPFLHVYANNVTNLQLPMSVFAPQLGFLVMGLGAVTYALLKVLPSGGQIWLTAIATFLMILGWLQTNFFIGSFGFLAGETPDWSLDRINQILQLLLLIGLGIGVLIFRKAVSSNVSFITGLLLLSSLAYVPSLLESAARVEVKKYTFNRDGVYDFSKVSNVVIFVLDSAQADVVYEVLSDNPGLADRYQGFTLFRNSLSPFPKTYASIPALLSGEAYDNSQPLHEYLEEVYLERSLPARLTDRGFDSRLLSSSPHALLAHPRVAANVSDIDGSTVANATVLSDESELIANLILFRISPHLLKPLVYNNGDFRIKLEAPSAPRDSTTCTLGDDNREYSKERKSFDNVFLDEFHNCAQVAIEQPALKFYHLYAPHAPYQLDEEFQFIGSKPLTRQWFELQTRGILNAMGEVLSVMEAREMMQNSLIIITSDHGEGEYDVGVEYPNGLPEETGAENTVGMNIVRGGMPLMMVKRPEDSGNLQFSDAPVQLTDVPATVYDWLDIEDSTDGKPMFTLDENTTRPRYHRYYQFAGWNIDYIVPLTEYVVDGFSWYPTSWSLSDRTFNQSIIDSFEGEFLTLSRDGNFDQWAHSGWTTPGKVARGVTEQGATVRLTGNGPSLLTAKHSLYAKEDTTIRLFQDGKAIGSWSFHKNDGQRAKTQLLNLNGDFELGLQTESDVGRAVRFRELRLEPVSKYAYRIGTPINFTDVGNSAEYRTYGWSRTEYWGTSSIGHASGVILALKDEIQSPLNLNLHLSGYVYEQWPSQVVEVYANETHLGTLELTDRKPATHTLVINPDAVGSSGVLDISLRYTNPLRQKDHGISHDTRLQAIAMVELSITPPDDNEAR